MWRHVPAGERRRSCGCVTRPIGTKRGDLVRSRTLPGVPGAVGMALTCLIDVREWAVPLPARVALPPIETKRFWQLSIAV